LDFKRKIKSNFGAYRVQMEQKISIIIPAYNEEKHILNTLVSVIRYCETHFDDFEVICIDDHSKDMTIYSISLFQHNYPKQIKLIRNKKNMGKGYSVKVGMKSAKYSPILVMDADSSASIKELPKLLKYIALGYDMVAGSRYSEDSKITTPQSLLRKLYSRAFNRLVEYGFHLGIKDTQCGFCCYTRKARDMITDLAMIDRFSYNVEHFVIMKQNHLMYREAGIRWGDTKPSHVKLKQIKEMYLDLLEIQQNMSNGLYVFTE
jgi:dolichyl-phosphate beta-glucosyltransferase